jgi:hypothetical protein
MPSEPEKPIEKLLRSSARERRDRAGDGWEMHPANRRVLQGEVVRRFGRKAPSKPRWFEWLFAKNWARPIGMAAAVTFVVAAAWISSQVLTSKNPTPLLAKNEHQAIGHSVSASVERDKLSIQRTDSADESRRSEVAQADSVLNRPEEAPAKGAQQNPIAGGKELALDRSLSDKKMPADAQAKPLARQEPLPVAAPPNGTTLATTATESSLNQRYGLSPSLQRGTPIASTTSGAAPAIAGLEKSAGNSVAKDLPAAPPAELQIANAGTILPTTDTNFVEFGYFAATQVAAQNGGAVRQLRENEALTRNKAATLATRAQQGNQILVSFRVEQSGSELRVIDQDGSVYTGPIQQTNSVTGTAFADGGSGAVQNLQGFARRQYSVPQQNSKTQQQSIPLSAFQVIGTNRTSNQKVVFSGVLDTATPDVARIPVKSDAAAGRLAKQIQPLQQNLRLSGNAMIGSDQVIQIEAVPAQPPIQHGQ